MYRSRPVKLISQHLDADAIITTDAGNFAGWVHKIFRFKPTQYLLGAACGAMGLGVPAGVAACLRHPDRQVIAFCGDGGALMNGNELSTAVAHKLDLKVIVSNNNSYGTIRLHQQKHFPDRVVATDLVNPDFPAWAKAFGAKGIRVDPKQDGWREALLEALKAPGPTVIEVPCEPDVLPK